MQQSIFLSAFFVLAACAAVEPEAQEINIGAAAGKADARSPVFKLRSNVTNRITTRCQDCRIALCRDTISRNRRDTPFLRLESHIRPDSGGFYSEGDERFVPGLTLAWSEFDMNPSDIAEELGVDAPQLPHCTLVDVHSRSHEILTAFLRPLTSEWPSSLSEVDFQLIVKENPTECEDDDDHPDLNDTRDEATRIDTQWNYHDHDGVRGVISSALDVDWYVDDHHLVTGAVTSSSSADFTVDVYRECTPATACTTPAPELFGLQGCRTTGDTALDLEMPDCEGMTYFAVSAPSGVAECAAYTLLVR